MTREHVIAEPFRVEAWSRDGQRLEEVLASALSVTMARAAYDVAIRDYPTTYITLRQRARVIAVRPANDDAQIARAGRSMLDE